jgi:hypothetical protein
MKGIVYLISSNNKNYVGSTIQKLSQRLAAHRCFDLYDMDKLNYSVKVLEEIEYEDKKELRIREQYWIDKINCCNVLRADGLSKKEYDRQNYLQNRDERIKRGKVYQEQNVKKLKEYNTERYKNNKDKWKEYYSKTENKIRANKNRKENRERKITWGGDPRSNNNLLMIDVTIFL